MVDRGPPCNPPTLASANDNDRQIEIRSIFKEEGAVKEEDAPKEARNRLGVLCDQISRWPDLCDIIRDAGAENELREILNALICSENLTEEKMRQVLSWLQVIDNSCAHSMGLIGIASRQKAFHSLPPGLSDDSDTQAWICPRDRCDRVDLSTESSLRPSCAMFQGILMRPFNLPSS